jgi:two-component system OmpR family sensor kinase
VRRLSLRVRLLLIVLAFVAVGLVISNVIVLHALRDDLMDRIDGQLRTLANIYSVAPPQSNQLINQTLGLDLVNNVDILYVGPDGTVLQSAHRYSGPLTPVGPAFTAGNWRVLATPRRAAPFGTVVVAASLDQVDATVDRLTLVCALTGAGVLVLLLGAGWFAVRRGLRPLRDIEETAVAIAGGDLSHRVPVQTDQHTEIGRLSGALNGMLAQLEASEDRMRRFVADASHELRTPLFGIRGFTELYRMGGLREPADVERTMARIEQESDRLARLVEDLLLLDARPTLHPEPMDLRSLAADARQDLSALDPARPVTLTGPGGSGPPGPAPVVADEERLRPVVTNLVGNAAAHTPAGTPVRIGVGTRDGQSVLEVADEGPGMTAEQAARVFDRFYRADESRHGGGVGGAGLGLSIAESLVKAQGGRIELETAPGRGATFRILLPAFHH